MISLLIFVAWSRAESVSEYQVKALFIYNFAKFVEWPPDTFTSPHEPITICIAGEDPFGSEMDEAVKGKTVNSRELVVKRIAKGKEPTGCQILFIGAAEKKYTKFLLMPFTNAAILSVGEADGFMESGGVIGFAMDSKKVRFDINLEAAERAHLKISSKLLSLARSVKEQGKQ